MPSMTFGVTEICPRCKARKGRSIYGRGYIDTTREWARTMGYVIIKTLWHVALGRISPRDAVRVRCPECGGRGVVGIDG